MAVEVFVVDDEPDVVGVLQEVAVDRYHDYD